MDKSEFKQYKTEQMMESQKLKKCNLEDLDIENTCFHFTDESSLKSIINKGLISNIGKHSKGIDEKPSIFFSYGIIPTIQGTEVWIKWIMHRMYGEKNQFHVYDGLDESKIKLEQSNWVKEFLSKEYLKDSKRKEKVFELIYNSLKERVFLTIDLKPGIDFYFEDIDYNKQKAFIQKKNGNIIPYLFMKEMYGNYSDLNSNIMDKWNMHTLFDAQIAPERIMQVTDSRGRTDMLHILIEMYDRCKSYKDCQFDILGDFIAYAKQKEFDEKQISTQKSCQENLKYSEESSLLDER